MRRILSGLLCLFPLAVLSPGCRSADSASKKPNSALEPSGASTTAAAATPSAPTSSPAAAMRTGVRSAPIAAPAGVVAEAVDEGDEVDGHSEGAGGGAVRSGSGGGRAGGAGSDEGLAGAGEDEGASAPARRARVVDTGPRSVVDVEVRRGESMGLYARWAKLPMRELYGRTDLSWGETLEVGRRLSFSLTASERGRLEAGRAALRSSRGQPAEAGSEGYRVRMGDSSWRIARRRGVPLWRLEQLNPGRDLSRLQVGDTIRVPSGGGES